ncbi:MAG: hypothetical protein HYX61_13080 [Gammaproteobacteria bacterium]|jgi:hypothetical protein|nr:hypothetical protein [Gammaproteobacteria bacterium]
MSKILIKVVPGQGHPEPSSVEFSNAFQAFYDIPEIKALFSQVLKEGDITFAFRNQPDVGWFPETREIMLPISLLNSSPVVSFNNIAKMLCQMTGKLANDAYFMMLRAKQNSPEAFNLLASKVNITPDNLIFEYCLRAGFTELTPEQEDHLTLAKLNIDYRGLDAGKQVQIKKLFETLVQMGTFKSLIEGMTKDKIMSTFFVGKDKLPANIPVSIHQNSYILIDKDASLIGISQNLIRVMIGISLENKFVKYGDYPSAEDYAKAFVKSLYDLEFGTAKKMIALLGNRKANKLLSLFLNKPIDDELVKVKLKQLLTHYQNVMKTPFDDFLQANIAIYTESKKDFQIWQQKNRPQDVPLAEISTSQVRVIVDEEVKPSPMTTSFQTYRQAEDSSSEMIEQDIVSFPDLIRNCVERYKTYACSDARNYSQCIYPGKENEILQRYKDRPIHLLQFEAKANSDAARGIYTPFTLKQISLLIDKAKSGCCTTFAIAALHRLLSENPNLRVQMVASPVQGMTAHCFLLISNNQNEKDIMIADPWLASLGWEGVFTPETYPFQHYFTENLICLFDSEQASKPSYSNRL